jgi:hypothetical protein
MTGELRGAPVLGYPQKLPLNYRFNYRKNYGKNYRYI